MMLPSAWADWCVCGAQLGPRDGEVFVAGEWFLRREFPADYTGWCDPTVTWQPADGSAPAIELAPVAQGYGLGVEYHWFEIPFGATPGDYLVVADVGSATITVDSTRPLGVDPAVEVSPWGRSIYSGFCGCTEEHQLCLDLEIAAPGARGWWLESIERPVGWLEIPAGGLQGTWCLDLGCSPVEEECVELRTVGPDRVVGTELGTFCAAVAPAETLPDDTAVVQTGDTAVVQTSDTTPARADRSCGCAPVGPQGLGGLSLLLLAWCRREARPRGTRPTGSRA